MSNSTLPPTNPIESLLECRLLMIPIMLGIAAGAVVSIAGGYYMTYQLVTLLGN